MSRELFGLDLLEGAPHGQTSGVNVACREKLIDNLQRHHRIGPLGTIGGRLLGLLRAAASLTMAASGGSFARPVMRS